LLVLLVHEPVRHATPSDHRDAQNSDHDRYLVERRVKAFLFRRVISRFFSEVVDFVYDSTVRFRAYYLFGVCKGEGSIERKEEIEIASY